MFSCRRSCPRPAWVWQLKGLHAVLRLDLGAVKEGSLDLLPHEVKIDQHLTLLGVVQLIDKFFLSRHI